MPIRIRAMLLLSGLVLALAAAPAGASTAQSLHLRFTRIAGYATTGQCEKPLWTSGAYTLVAESSRPSATACASRYLLLNDRTGRRTVITPKGYTYILAFGAPWILFDEAQQFELYDVTTGRFRALGCTPNRCMPAGTYGYTLGADWLQFAVQQPGSCGDGLHNDCGPQTSSFYDVVTHRVRHAVHTTSTTMIDLDAPSLIVHVCAPLRVPSSGSLTFYGSVGLSLGTASSFLERCGSRTEVPTRSFTSGQPAGSLLGSASLLLEQVAGPYGGFTGSLVGALLPSLRAVTATIPSRLASSDDALALDRYRLTVATADGALWSAAVP